MRVVNNGDLDGFEIEGVRIVGTEEVQGHIAVEYDVDADNNPDIAIVDVDDSGDISAPDIVLDTEGHMATMGELYEAGLQLDDDTNPANMPVNEDPLFAQNPDVAPDMPDYMNDAVVEA